MPEYISPTQLELFFKDRVEYYVSYLAEQRPPRRPQTMAMAIGSAFDAFCKSHLNQMLYGTVDPAFEVATLFENQVEPQNRDYTWKHGHAVFEAYKSTGALADLMIELDQASEPPKFEFTIQARLPHSRCINGIPLLGKPDVYFKTKDGVHVIYDWKVNGYMGTKLTSPKPGYLKLRPGNAIHKNCLPTPCSGLMINCLMPLERVDMSWANQLSTYAWLVGSGPDFIVGIEQITSNGRASNDDVPSIRVASHRCKVSENHQHLLLEKYAAMQSIIESGHIFDDRTREESDAKCRELDEYYKQFEGNTDADAWLNGLIRQHPY